VVNFAYEPGSVFKVLTLTAAIENGAVTPDQIIDCQMGKINVAGRLIHDWKPFGMLSVAGILANSSDVGAIKVALRLGSPRFYDVIRAFGIGQPTGIALPGENRGLLRPLKNWSANSIGSVAMGQEVSVTPIQMVSAISAIANGGTLYPPRIIREIRDDVPATDLPNSGAAPRNVTDARTAATMREMMEGVMIEGTGKHDQLDGYTSGGKSGTAQKIDPATGRYSRTEYNASFVGFAPVNNPAVTILVVLDSPVGQHHGGVVSGPIFKRIAEQVLAYMGVPHDVPSREDVETAKNQQPSDGSRPDDADGSAEARFEAAATRSGDAPTVASGDPRAVLIPDLAGQTVRGVTEQCSHLGLEPALIGNGVALEQFPAAGAQVLPGSRVTVRFGRAGEFLKASAQGMGN
jgi:cell division protein FtsI (penicillin-binding protein 3)